MSVTPFKQIPRGRSGLYTSASGNTLRDASPRIAFGKSLPLAGSVSRSPGLKNRFYGNSISEKHFSKVPGPDPGLEEGSKEWLAREAQKL